MYTSHIRSDGVSGVVPRDTKSLHQKNETNAITTIQPSKKKGRFVTQKHAC